MPKIKNPIIITDHAIERFNERIGPIDKWRLLKRVQRATPADLTQYPPAYLPEETSTEIALEDYEAIYICRKRRPQNHAIFVATVLSRHLLEKGIPQ